MPWNKFNLQRFLRSDRIIHSGYGVLVCILISAGLIAERSLREIEGVFQRRGNAEEVILEIQNTISLIKDAETGQRGFLLTGKEHYLEPYFNAVKKIDLQFNVLQQKQDGFPQNLDRINRLREITKLKMSELEETIQLRRTQGYLPALKVVLTDRGRNYMREARQIIQAISNDQKQRGLELAEEAKRVQRNGSFVVFTGSSISILLALIGFVLLEKNRRRRILADKLLSKSNAILEDQKSKLSRIVETQNALIAAGLETQKILDLVVFHATRLSDAEGAVIEFIDGDFMVYRAAYGSANSFLGLRIKKEGSLTGLSLKESKPIICADTELDQRVNREACRKVNVRSMIVVPLKHQDRPIGVLKVSSSQPNCFGESQLEPLTLIVGILATTLGQAIEFEEKRTAIATLQETEKQLILARDQAQAATQTKSLFLANMSHEIRTPINGILGMIGILLDSPLSSQQLENAKLVEQSAEFLLEIVNDILDFSKVEAGKLELENLEFDLVSTLQDLKKSFGLMVEKKGLLLKMEIDSSFPLYINGDPGRLRQVIINLVGNAIKFTSKGEISLFAKKVEETSTTVSIRFEVQDSGIGISEEQLKRLFQVFTQADTSTTRKFGGTGLGLSISQRLVELMGGKIDVKSRENYGSTFGFTIPFKKSTVIHPKSESDSYTLDSLNQWNGIRILIAEDNPINQKVAISQLEKLGIRADAVGNGLEAIHALKLIPYHLVLMDCQMPEMDGYAATQAIRADENAKYKSIPIIAMTANAISGDRERCLKAGMSDYIAKPVKLKALENMLKRWLETSKESSPLDSSVVQELKLLDSSDAPSLLKELSDLFLTSTPNKLMQMKTHLKSENIEAIAKIAHQLKSGGGNLGATEFAKICQKIEDVDQKNFKLEQIEELIISLEKEYERVQKALKEEVLNAA